MQFYLQYLFINYIFYCIIKEIFFIVVSLLNRTFELFKIQNSTMQLVSIQISQRRLKTIAFFSKFSTSSIINNNDIR